MKILLIEDDAKTAEYVKQGLKQCGYVTEVASDGATGLLRAETEDFDLAIIDIMLPKIDGFTVIQKIRAAEKKLPIIILSACDSVEHKIKGLETGGDDYLAKPFSFAELLARIQALLRRASSVSEPVSLEYLDLSMNFVRRKVFRGGQEIQLQPLEFQLLEYLIRTRGRVVSKTVILEHVWEYNFNTDTNIVEVCIFRLREKIDKPFERKLIKTVRGFGYVLE